MEERTNMLLELFDLRLMIPFWQEIHPTIPKFCRDSLKKERDAKCVVGVIRSQIGDRFLAGNPSPAPVNVTRAQCEPLSKK